MRAAVNAAIIELGANNHQEVSDATRRVLLRVMPGGKFPSPPPSPIEGEVRRTEEMRKLSALSRERSEQMTAFGSVIGVLKIGPERRSVG